MRITLSRTHPAPLVDDAATEGDDDGVRRRHPAPSTQRLAWKLREFVAKKSVRPDGANRQHATTGLNSDFIDLLIFWHEKISLTCRKAIIGIRIVALIYRTVLCG